MSAQNNEVNELLRKGIEAARDGERAAAREYLQEVVDIDERNEKGWFWLASVVDTDEERRVCLSNVLHINPNNDKAKKAMDALEAKARQKVNSEEVIPGITRHQLTLVLGGGIAVILIIVLIFAASSINRNNEIAAQNAMSTTIVIEQTAFVQTATQSSIDGTSTQRAIATETPTPTETSSRATLPPSWTPSSMPTLAETAAPLPPVTGLRGFIAAISGIDVLNNDFLSVGYFNLEQGGTFNLINDDYGRDPAFTPDGQRVVYVRYDQLSFSSVIEFVNVNGTDVENLTATQAGMMMLDPEQTQFSNDGRLVTFIARGTGQTSQVFVYDRFGGEVRQLTDTDSEFSYPSFSPDGTRLVAIRDDVSSANPGADIVLIDVTTGGQVAVSTDRAAFIETMPRWSQDGRQIIYSVAAGNDLNNFDIFIRNADGTGSPLPLVRESGSELYPVVSPDGQHLAFSSNRTGVWDIYIYNIQSGTLSQLTQSPEEDYPTDWWQPFS